MGIKKRWLYIVGIIIIGLVVTNPSTSRFKDYAADVNLKNQRYVFKRTQNWLLFSIYKKELHYYNSDTESMEILNTETYLGIFLNFVNITPGQIDQKEVTLKPEKIPEPTAMDTSHASNGGSNFKNYIDSLKKIKGYEIDLLKESATYNHH